MPFGIIAGVVSAVAGVAGGIAGASQAQEANDRADSNEKAQKKFNKKTARLTNEYNDKLDAADLANYQSMREYSHDMSMQNWQRGKEIQDYKYARSLQEYQKSEQITGESLGLNTLAASLGVDSELASVEDMFIQQQYDREAQLSSLRSVYAEGNLQIKEAGVKMLGIQSQLNSGSAAINNQIDQLMKQGAFKKQDALVKGLVAQGRAALGQAGTSTAKSQQSASAELQRGIMSLEAELTGKRKAAGIQLAQLNTETSLAKTGVGINLERIKNTIDSASEDYQFNNRVLASNMESFINQAERNVKQIYLQKQYADVNVKASAMIKPERLSYDPVPQLPPEREFVERMEAIPGFVPQAAQQSVWAPMISGIAKGAGALSGLDFGGGGGGYSTGNKISNFGGGSMPGAFTPGGTLNTF